MSAINHNTSADHKSAAQQDRRDFLKSAAATTATLAACSVATSTVAGPTILHATDKAGSKVTIGFTSLTMFLSVVRLRVLYSPLAPVLRWLRPIEGWVYKRLRAPVPLRRNAPAREVDSSVTASSPVN